MPLLDVTDVLSDPDFATTFDVIRSTETVSATGRAVFTPVTTAGVIGVVTPASTQDLQRLADLERQGGSIVIHTTFALTAGAGPTTADIVVWPAGGTQQYTVEVVDDYTQFGSGFVHAVCQVRSLI